MAHSPLLLLALVGCVAAQLQFQPGNPYQARWTPPAAPRRFPVLPPPAPVRKQCEAVSARADLIFPGGVSGVSGAVFFYQECRNHPVIITGLIKGLEPGQHGMHVHENPNLSDKCSGAGGHYNPFQSPHGAQTDSVNARHVGDLGNIVADYKGEAEVNLVDTLISLFRGDAKYSGH